MNFSNKVRVNKKNKRMLEILLGEFLFEGDIVYLHSDDRKELEEKEDDFIGIVTQEIPTLLTIWDEQNGIVAFENSFVFNDEEIKEFEPLVKGIFEKEFAMSN